MKKIIITAIGKDSPGLVNKITSVINHNNGNIENSKMIKIKNQFALILDFYLAENLDSIKSELENIEKSRNAFSMSDVSLDAPLPQPSKIFCMGANYTEFGHREPGPMWGFQKSNDTVIGPG